MKSIHKYPLPLSNTFSLSMPVGARPLHVHHQHGEPCLWAMVDPIAPPALYEFAFVGTGWQCPDEQEGTYIGTVHIDAYVWHLFRLHGEGA